MVRSKRAMQREIKIPRPTIRAGQKQIQERKMRNIVGTVLALFAGLFISFQGYQGITGASITGNVVGASFGGGVGGLTIIIGMLVLVGAFLMIVSETMRFGGILTIVLGLVGAVATMGASLIPSLIAIVGGFLGMTAD